MSVQCGPIPNRPSIERLQGIAAWMKVNGDAIHGTTASPFPKAPAWGRCTTRHLPAGNTRLYLQVFAWPADGRLVVTGLTKKPLTASLLAKPGEALKLTSDGDSLTIAVPAQAPDPIATVIALDLAP